MPWIYKNVGNTRPEMTQRFGHLAPVHLAKAIQIVSFSGEQRTKEFVVDNSVPDMCGLLVVGNFGGRDSSHTTLSQA